MWFMICNVRLNNIWKEGTDSTLLIDYYICTILATAYLLAVFTSLLVNTSQQLHDLVQEKDSFVAELSHKLYTVLKENEHLQRQIKAVSYQQLSLMSSQKSTGTSYIYYYNQKHIALF